VKKNFIIDTNVLIHDPQCIYKFADNHVIIPIIVIEELDNLKKREDATGFQARNAAREINRLREKGNLFDGILTKFGGTIRVELNNVDLSILPDGLDQLKNDNIILSVTLNIKKENLDIPTILVTKDVYLSIKADSLGIEVQDYQNDRISVNEIYTGYIDLSFTSKEIDTIFQNGMKPSKKVKEMLYPNTFIKIKSKDKNNHEVLTIYDGEKIIPLKYQNSHAYGILPLNIEQKMAFELLMDPKIPLVTLSGGAGSGKTVVSTAVALQKVIEENQYRKVVFVKPVIPAGNDIGFLPGSENEKLKPWMGSFYDAVDFLLGNKQKKKEKNVKQEPSKATFTADSILEFYRDKGIIEMKTFNYMRGRTLSDSLVIIDEAQELTPHLAKLMLTRAGIGSKFIFLGDPSNSQIDNIFVDERSNGLVYLIEKMKSSNLSGHVTLNKVERSPLAQVAENTL
jgi:PhoH-like ATPase